MKTAPFDVVVLGGRVYCDLIFAGMPRLPELGSEVFARCLTVTAGGSANTAIALRRLGLRPALLADLGTDVFSEMSRRILEREGIDTGLIRQHPFPAPAVTVSIPLKGERALLSFQEPEEFPPYDARMLQQVSARHLHICGLRNGLQHRSLVHAASGLCCSLDCACEEVDLEAPLVSALLARTDYLMCNEAEALAMTGTDDVRKAAKTLAAFGPTVIIKQGAEGATAFVGGQYVQSPAITACPVTVGDSAPSWEPLRPVDTTGAGDCFAAGFILGLLRGFPLELCLRYGNIAGGLSTRGYGAVSSPTLREISAYF